MMLKAILSALPALPLAGCGEEGAAPRQTDVVDSLGVRWVFNPSEAGRELTLGGEPLLRLGNEAGDSTTFFRVVGGILTDGDEIVVGNAGSSEVFVFDRSGASIRRLGRPGDGPGEFQSLGWVHARSDGGIHAGDFGIRRVTAYGPDGELAWSRTYRPATSEPADPRTIQGNGFFLAALDDGSIIGAPSALAHPDGTPGPLPVRAELRRYTPDQDTSEHLSDVSMIVWYEDPAAGRVPIAGYRRAPRMRFSANSERLAYTEGLSHRIDVIDHGTPTMVITEARARAEFQPDSLPAGVYAPDSLPSYDEILVDSERRVWALRGAPEEDPNRTWVRFSHDGIADGRLILPGDARILDARSGEILVLRRDELDVESIELWPLEQGSSSTREPPRGGETEA